MSQFESKILRKTTSRVHFSLTCSIALLSYALLPIASHAGDSQLTLEMLYHPTKKIKFDPAPLSRLAWDAQNRLVETITKDGITQRFVVEPSTGEKLLIPVNGQLLQLLNAAGIESKEAEKLAETLGKQVKPDTKRLIFTYKNDLWLFDLSAGKVKQITNSPLLAEDEAILSPDTNYVAYLKGNDLYLTDIHDISEQRQLRETRLTTGGSETIFNGRLDWVYQEELYGRGSYRAFWWAPDSKNIAFLSLDETKVPVYTLSGDHVQPIKTEHIRYPKAGDPNPIAQLGVVNLKAEVRWQANPYPNQETLLVQVGWTPDGRLQAAWQDRIQTWLDLRFYDASGASKLIIHETSPAWVERLPLPNFLKDGSFIWQSERTGHRHFYHYAPDGSLKQTLTQGEWDVRELLGIDEVNQRLFFTANQANPIGEDHYVIDLAQPQQAAQPKKLSQEKGSHTIRWNANFTTYLDSWSSIEQAPKQALFSYADGQSKLVRLIDNPGTPAAYSTIQRATVKQQQIPTRDGFAMESLLFLPPHFDPKKKYPVFHHLYGGPMAPLVKDRWNSYAYFHFLAQQGIVVWVLDNRSASNKGIASAWPIYKKLGQLELQDQLDGLVWLEKQGWADMARIAIDGWSYGGTMASYALTHSKAWKLGLIGAPVTDWRLYDSIYTERYMTLPKDNPTGYDSGSVLQGAKNLSGRALIMHGTIDDNVHPQNTLLFIDALIKADKDYQLQLYPGQRHGVRDEWMVWSLQKAKWAFLKANL